MKQPLAHRMRPTNIQEIIGQQHLVGEGKILWRIYPSQSFSIYDFIRFLQVQEKHPLPVQLLEVPVPRFVY